MKKLSILALLLCVYFVTFSCNRSEEVQNIKDSNSTSNLINNLASTNSVNSNDLITDSFFMFGVRSYEIVGDEIIFDTYRDYSVNGEIGNINDYSFTYDGVNVHLDDTHHVGVVNDELILVTPDQSYVIDSEFNFGQLDMISRIVFMVYVELYLDSEYKHTFESHVNSLTSRGCSWSDTYYISGWGYTQGAAWADYSYNMEQGNGIPGWSGCSALGEPEIRQHHVKLGVLTISYYQVDHAFCCQ